MRLRPVAELPWLARYSDGKFAAVSLMVAG